MHQLTHVRARVTEHLCGSTGPTWRPLNGPILLLVVRQNPIQIKGPTEFVRSKNVPHLFLIKELVGLQGHIIRVAARAFKVHKEWTDEVFAIEPPANADLRTLDLVIQIETDRTIRERQLRIQRPSVSNEVLAG